MSKADLKLDWCSYAAAKYAVEKWHYSRTMPAGKLVKVGVWEGGPFIGCVLFGRGANNHIGQPFGLPQTEVAELVRVALSRHRASVTRVVRVALRMLRAACPGLRLLVSYADPEQGHNGAIYQAGNWMYLGSSRPQRETLGQGGEIVHKRTVHSRYGTIKGQRPSAVLWKHKYAYPLDAAMRAQIEPLRKPYPKRAGSVGSDTAATHAAEGGATPTPALCSHGDQPCEAATDSPPSSE